MAPWNAKASKQADAGSTSSCYPPAVDPILFVVLAAVMVVGIGVFLANRWLHQLGTNFENA